jgi:hypothetical protein
VPGGEIALLRQSRSWSITPHAFGKAANRFESRANRAAESLPSMPRSGGTGGDPALTLS